MCKESWGAGTCVCGRIIQFQEQHWPHCPMNPDNLNKVDRGQVEQRFTKAELAGIARHGPMRDEPVRKVRGKGSRKPDNAKSKSKAKR